MKKINFLLILSLIFISFSVTNCAEEPRDVSKNLKLTDISYGPDERNKMDVFLPANRNSETPVVLIIHGGGWVSGNKEDMKGLQEMFLANGIASVNMNYRFVSATVHCDDLMHDVGKVVNQIIENGEEWQINNRKIVLLGFSAGAHMSLMYGYTTDSKSRIGGIISAAGPTNLYNPETLKLISGLLPDLFVAIQNLANAVYDTSQPVLDKFRLISPITRIKNVPTLMIQGTADMMVSLASVQEFKAALDKHGVVNELITLEGVDHGFTNLTPDMTSSTNMEMVNWVRTYTK